MSIPKMECANIFAYSKGHKKHPSNQHFLLKEMFILIFILFIFAPFIQAKGDNATIEISNFLQNEVGFGIFKYFQINLGHQKYMASINA